MVQRRLLLVDVYSGVVYSKNKIIKFYIIFFSNEKIL